MHKDSVTSVRYDPGSGCVIASASADGKVIISSAYDEELDKEGTGPFAGVRDDYGEVLFTFKSGTWNNTLAFSQSGSCLAFASHDCEMHFVEFTADKVAAKDKPSSQKVVYHGQPILNGLFTKEDTYIGGGYDNAPMVFKNVGGKWEFKGSLDDGIKTFRDPKIGQSAFEKTALFEKITADASVISKPRDTKHQNYINCT